MVTLHIEHGISDLGVWLGAFRQFADARREGGVRSEVVRQPVDDERSLMVDLEFDDEEAAEAFRTFLETVVWASRDASPALEGTPRAVILRAVTT